MINLIDWYLTTIKYRVNMILNMLKKNFYSILSVMPKGVFWKRYFKKLISYTISMKVHILALTTYLLLIDKIGPTVWSTVFLGVALGRIVEKKIYSDSALELDDTVPQDFKIPTGE